MIVPEGCIMIESVVETHCLEHCDAVNRNKYRQKNYLTLA